MKRYLFVLILFVFLFTGCNKSDVVKLVEGKDYKVNGEFSGKYLDFTKRGYYIDTLNEPNAPYFYIICMGEKNTGGYGLKIKEVNKNENKTEIIVEEIVPGKDDVVTMAFTYPTIVVEFPKYQEDIVIKNTDGEEYTELID